MLLFHPLGVYYMDVLRYGRRVFAPVEVLQPVFGFPCIDLEVVGLAPIHQAVGQFPVVPLCDEAMVRSLLRQVCSAEAEEEWSQDCPKRGPCTEEN